MKTVWNWLDFNSKYFQEALIELFFKMSLFSRHWEAFSNILRKMFFYEQMHRYIFFIVPQRLNIN
jgi:hypothetical protein